MQLRTDTPANQCKWLSLAIAGLWLPAVAVAKFFYGVADIEAATVSAVSCLLAGCTTFWVAAGASQARTQAFAVLMGSAIRGIFALAGVFTMQFLLALPYENYLIWLSLFYLVSLALETALLIRPHSGSTRS